MWALKLFIQLYMILPFPSLSFGLIRINLFYHHLVVSGPYGAGETCKQEDICLRMCSLTFIQLPIKSNLEIRWEVLLNTSLRMHHSRLVIEQVMKMWSMFSGLQYK